MMEGRAQLNQQALPGGRAAENMAASIAASIPGCGLTGSMVGYMAPSGGGGIVSLTNSLNCRTASVWGASGMHGVHGVTTTVCLRLLRVVGLAACDVELLLSLSLPSLPSHNTTSQTRPGPRGVLDKA